MNLQTCLWAKRNKNRQQKKNSRMTWYLPLADLSPCLMQMWCKWYAYGSFIGIAGTQSLQGSSQLSSHHVCTALHHENDISVYSHIILKCGSGLSVKFYVDVPITSCFINSLHGTDHPTDELLPFLACPYANKSKLRQWIDRGIQWPPTEIMTDVWRWVDGTHPRIPMIKELGLWWL